MMFHTTDLSYLELDPLLSQILQELQEIKDSQRTAQSLNEAYFGDLLGTQDEELGRQRKEILDELEDIRQFQQSAHSHNELFLQDLLEKQYALESGLGEIYRQGHKEKETLVSILSAVNQQRIEQAKVGSTVESLRLWAKLVQQTGLPMDNSLRLAIESLGLSTEYLGGVSRYLEVNLPLIPFLNYKFELSSEHATNLLKGLWLYLWELWKEIKHWEGIEPTHPQDSQTTDKVVKGSHKES